LGLPHESSFPSLSFESGAFAASDRPPYLCDCLCERMQTDANGYEFESKVSDIIEPGRCADIHKDVMGGLSDGSSMSEQRKRFSVRVFGTDQCSTVERSANALPR
jgi:hypothetical protein